MKKIILTISLILSAALPIVAKAEAIVLECYQQGNCGFCDALKFAVKLAGILLTIAGSLSLLFFVIAGLILIVSQGNPGRIAAGQKMIIGSIIGLVLTYTAWVGVNFIIANFVGQNQTGVEVAQIFGKKWQEFKCLKTEESVFTPSPVIPEVPLSESCKQPVSSFSGGTCAGFQTAGIKTSQCADVSPALHKLLSCMQALIADGFTGNNLKTNDIIITSISDDAGLIECRDFWTDPKCAHTKKSCHYGGPFKYTDGSYAADIRSYSLTQNQAFLLEVLVNKAGGNFIDETNISGVAPHYHISAIECGGK